ncbi:hypothetical protein WN944_013891 [Citrus x changshan-huyou]|uniref:NAC domain-containing protein n=1 Tax=Citrus x changshan-huyou TaxID=2935761 RepID=A0AAP0MB64_9ROSI
MDLPVGYRFMPTDEELVFHYLINKACNRALPAQAVKEITARDLYLKHPKCSDITAPSSSGENKEWYFFIPEEENSFHRSGKETTRFVGDGTGFWKLIGEERPMFNINGQVFALKRNLTYFSGNPSEPRRTHWKMELFRLPLEFYTSQNPKEKGEKWVLGRVKRGNEFKGCF